jgi:hypothetical protein
MYGDCPKAVKDANYALQKKYDDILWEINRIEQLEYAASTENRPFREIPPNRFQNGFRLPGGFPAAVIGETIWTKYKEAWQCRRKHPMGIDLTHTAELMKDADAFIALFDDDHKRAQEDYNGCVQQWVRVI